MKNGKYYLGWGWGSDENIEPSMGEFDSYEEALKAAKKSHKEEIKYEKERDGDNSDVMNTYVFLIKDGYEYNMCTISGLRSKIEEWEYED